MSGAYSEEELTTLSRLGHRRTAVHLFDLAQTHLSEFGAGRRERPRRE